MENINKEETSSSICTWMWKVFVHANMNSWDPNALFCCSFKIVAVVAR